MSLYRKKPVVIEARQFTHANIEQIARWVNSNGASAFTGRESIAIETLEGQMIAMPGDWIIKGVQGEFYPCRDDIFRETYEVVSDDAAR